MYLKQENQKEIKLFKKIDIPHKIRQKYFDYFNQRLVLLESSISKIKKRNDLEWSR